MLATLGPLPVTPSWGYEFKWDGVRAIVYIGDGRVRIFTRNDSDVSDTYPELQALAGDDQAAPHTRRGDRDDRPRRSNQLRPPPAAHARPATQCRSARTRSPFSCTRSTSSTTRTSSTLKAPYTERRTILEGVDLGDSPSKIPPYWTGDTGRDLLTAAADIGAEGVVAKRLESRINPAGDPRPGSRRPTTAPSRSSSAAGSPAPDADPAGSVRCCSACTTTRTDSSTSAMSALASPSRCSIQLQQMLEPLQRPTTPFDTTGPNPDTRDAHWTGPTSSARSSSGTGHPPRDCATRRGVGFDPTASPRRPACPPTSRDASHLTGSG